ncbi:N-ethylmaleimide reductase [Altererythrobacter atlanticus]|uniref:N-ethylmaleimide reductase n=1 Tax=Croceibacterium atlanticum TaxID=1267766 RepID=A0A0F7KSF0_9SPHN|nr:alkene reductase [Croceibacterium atlanticum]AKH42499.1 N-ethylmaleimide reductase [Croceibacterium atlanticum]MBB5731276.1 N-ethylmaleimide reductase [Croceibacterium atlanticum]
MTDTSILFRPLRAGAFELPNRVLMAPLTRNRARPDGTPKPMAAAYYRQRSSAGLIISEATQISAMGKGYIDTPGIYTDAHVEGWKPVIEAVHAAGGRIVCQLWHVGRISHTSLLPGGAQPVSASAVRANAKTFTADGFADTSEPVALDADGIARTLDDYSQAARCALAAGFDGVEVHSANGYLLDQFLQDRTNLREDEYGGSVENRQRLLREVLDRVCDAFPADRVGVRLSPLGQANDMGDSDPEATFSSAYRMLDERGLAYLHVIEQFYGQDSSEQDRALLKRLRGLYSGVYVGNGSYDAKRAARAIGAGDADAISFGRMFIANPDLPERFRIGASLNEPDQNSFYGGGTRGYTDYPFLPPAH